MYRVRKKIRNLLWKCRLMIDKANSLAEIADQVDTAVEELKTYRELVAVLKQQERILIRVIRKLDR